jgi:hypothetical protein
LGLRYGVNDEARDVNEVADIVNQMLRTGLGKVSG